MVDQQHGKQHAQVDEGKPERFAGQGIGIVAPQLPGVQAKPQAQALSLIHILDLKYEAREVPQALGNKAKIEDYFAKKTKHLNNFQKAALRKRWATMEEVLSSGERKNRIIRSILEDFDTRRRLSDGRGTAILVADEIYDACHYFRLFQNTDFGKHVGIITSFEPDKNQYSKEPAGSDYRYKYETYKDWVLIINNAVSYTHLDVYKRQGRTRPTTTLRWPRK